jgi:hypothetical protein
MRKAYHYTSWRKNGDDLCGINFGYDFCAEHEDGISGIRDSFGIKTYVGNPTINGIKKLFGLLKPQFGIDARVITKRPETLQFKQKGDFCGIYYSTSQFSDSIFEDGIRSLSWEMSSPKGNDLVCYWGSNSFMVVTTNQPNYHAIRKEFQHNNIAIFTAGRHGLVICFPDKLDDRTKTELYASDLNAWELRKVSEATGIEKELSGAKREFYALIPGWKNPGTKELWFWLNPSRQDIYKAGWFTAEELRLWIKGEGPVVKTDKMDEGVKHTRPDIKKDTKKKKKNGKSK